MHDTATALERVAGEFRTAFRGGRRQGAADAVGEVCGGLLDAPAILEHARPRQSAAVRRQVLAGEPRLAVEALEVVHDPGLQREKALPYRRE